MPSLSVLFRVCKEENQPSRLVCEVPSHTRFIKQFQTAFPLPKSVQMSNEDVHTVILDLGLTKHNRSQLIHTIVRISPHYRTKNGSLVPIGHKGRFQLFENRKKWNGNMA